MRLAAIADIHGNFLALEAVLADIAAQGIADIVNLGDHVSGPLEARRTADLLMACGLVTIQGDQDRRLVEIAREGKGNPARLDYRQLEPRHLDWLAAMPATLLYRDEVLLCHGSPVDDACYWLDHVTAGGLMALRPRAEIEAEADTAEARRASLILCGHTHIPRSVRLGDGRLVVNPGSVGLPAYEGLEPVPHKVEAGTPDASYAIVEKVAGHWMVTFRTVPYDHMAMAAMARRNGLASWADGLATGWIAGEVGRMS